LFQGILCSISIVYGSSATDKILKIIKENFQMRYLGANVSAAGGHENIVHAATRFNLNSVQTMPTAPLRWLSKEISQEHVSAFVNAQKGSVLKKFLIHGI